MKSKKNVLLANCVLTLCSLIILLLFFELVVFRLVFKASDIPRLAFENQVVKYEPSQQGVFRIKDAISAKFSVNAQGWNSGHAGYEIEKPKGVKRIAVIGDSLVDALQVDHDMSFSEQLETLGTGEYQVYRFAIGGAPLSQYLQLLRKEILQYEPDLIIVNISHTDFGESYNFKQGVYTSSFLKLEVADGQVKGEIQPKPLESRWYDPIRSCATWRFLGGRQQFKFQALRDMALGVEAQADEPTLDQTDAAETRVLNDRAVTRYVFERIKKLAKATDSKLLVTINSYSPQIYDRPEEEPDYSEGALPLNKMTGETMAALDIPFLDLHPIFVRAFERNRKPFEFNVDGHWNEYGHSVVAGAIRDFIKARKLI